MRDLAKNNVFIGYLRAGLYSDFRLLALGYPSGSLYSDFKLLGLLRTQQFEFC